MRDFIVDTDLGIDDMTSLLVILKQPDVNVRALTVVDGNVSCQQGVINSKIALCLTGQSHVKIHPGATGPLIRG
ncbi:hypothetical protein HDU76_011824, partial [Blyttiomyces sp. JEL0837]